MIIDTDRLITVKNLANKKGVTTTTVYKWLSNGREESIKIDGVTFIILKDEESREYKEKEEEQE